MPLSLGHLVVKRYRLDRLLGQGGFGSVWKATDTRLADDGEDGKVLAIKILHDDPDLPADAALRFRQEARILARLSHPGIPKVHDIAAEDELPHYFTLEYVEGETLLDVIRKGITLEDGLRYSVALLDILTAIHDAGVLHRDLKPENLLVAKSDGQLKLIDFGISKTEEHALVKTRTGVILGTLLYMPPEQMARGEYTRASDLYSAGLVVYELISARAPFPPRADYRELYRLKQSGTVEPLSYLVEQLPPALDVVVQRAISPDPGERPESARELRDEVARLIEVVEGRATGLKPLRTEECRPADARTGSQKGSKTLSGGATERGKTVKGRGEEKSIEVIVNNSRSPLNFLLRRGLVLTATAITAAAAIAIFRADSTRQTHRKDTPQVPGTPTDNHLSPTEPSILITRDSLNTLSRFERFVNREWLARSFGAFRPTHRAANAMSQESRSAAATEILRKVHILSALTKLPDEPCIEDAATTRTSTQWAELGGIELLEHQFQELNLKWPVHSIVNRVHRHWPETEPETITSRERCNYIKFGIAPIEKDTYFEDGPFTFTFAIPQRRPAPRSACLWFACRGLTSAYVIEATINKHRIILRKNPKSSQPPALWIRCDPTSIEGGGQVWRGDQVGILCTPKDEGSRSYVGRQIPTEWLNHGGVNHVTVNTWDLPGSRNLTWKKPAVFSKVLSIE